MNHVSLRLNEPVNKVDGFDWVHTDINKFLQTLQQLDEGQVGSFGVYAKV